MIVGPRLDRPSAVGDEGRPRSAGLAIATLLVVGYTVGIAEGLGLWAPIQLVALGVSMTIAGIALVDRSDTASPFVGHLLLLPGGLIALAGTVQAAVAGVEAVVLVGCLGLAMFGIAGAWADAVGRGRLTTAIEGGAVSAIVLILAALVVLVGLGMVVVLRPVLTVTLFPGPRPRLPGLLFVVGMSALAVRLALPRLPIATLAPRARRAALDRTVRRVTRVSTLVAILATMGWLALGLGWALGLVGSIGFGRSGLAAVLVGTPMRVGLVAVATAILGLALLAVLVARVARLDGQAVRTLAPVAGGIGLLTIPVPFLIYIMAGIATQPLGGWLFALLALVLVFMGAVLVLLGFASLAALAGLGLLPDRAAPLALAGVGLLGASLGVGLADGPAPVVFAGVAAATIAWDVSEFGLGLTAELGHRPDTRRLELLHGVASGGVGLAGVILAIVLSSIVTTVGAGSAALVPVAALAFVGSVLLAAGLRG